MTKKQIHAANNAVIAAAKAAAAEHGVSMVIAVGRLTEANERGQVVIGVDSEGADLELMLAASAHGAAVEREEARIKQRSESALVMGMKNQRSLFDRDDVGETTDAVMVGAR